MHMYSYSFTKSKSIYPTHKPYTLSISLQVPPEEVLKMMQDAGMDTSFHPLAFGVVAVMGRKKP